MVIEESKQAASINGGFNWVQVFGLLPAFYIGTSFLNFTVGAVLGMLMTMNQNWWGILAPIHAELNPYGWLTILIYGMTYAVLKWFADVVSPWPKLGWIQLIAAEVGVICVTLAHAASSLTFLKIGMLLQALAPILFLVNILVSVAAKRRRKADEVVLTSQIHDYVLQLSSAGYPITDSMKRVYETLGDTKRHYETDGVAQRGTDLALMIFVLAAVWASLSSLLSSSFSGYIIPSGVNILTYYGWISGTVLAVSLHLYQRYSPISYLHKKSVLIGQLLWLVGVVLSTVGFSFVAFLIPIGTRLLGLGLLWNGLVYLIPINRVFKGLTHQVHIAWKLSTLCLFLLGLGLFLGFPLMDLAMFHLMFLGWMTMLVYGVGYTFFPLLLRRMPRSKFVAKLQVWVGFFGTLFMFSGFYCMEHGLLLRESVTLLAIGGVSAALSALYFLVQWPLGKRVGNN